MHAGSMATSQRYLTIRGVIGAVVAASLDRLTCVRRGHDPVVITGETLCRRCYAMVRR